MLLNLEKSTKNFCPNLGHLIKTHFAAPFGQEIEKIRQKIPKIGKSAAGIIVKYFSGFQAW